mmetsp:Transcript_12702/g.29312  ORF Transcript_12702/g.29312 Transcript_12702/m.29312 type:complete len:84 (+) Transcript_12702:946-1197(+)
MLQAKVAVGVASYAPSVAGSRGELRLAMGLAQRDSEGRQSALSYDGWNGRGHARAMAWAKRRETHPRSAHTACDDERLPFDLA